MYVEVYRFARIHIRYGPRVRIKDGKNGHKERRRRNVFWITGVLSWRLEASPGLNPSWRPKKDYIAIFDKNIWFFFVGVNFFIYFFLSSKTEGHDQDSDSMNVNPKHKFCKCFFEQRSSPFTALLLTPSLSYPLTFSACTCKNRNHIWAKWRLVFFLTFSQMNLSIPV